MEPMNLALRFNSLPMHIYYLTCAVNTAFLVNNE